MNIEEWQKRVLKGPLFENETQAGGKDQRVVCPTTGDGLIDPDNTSQSPPVSNMQPDIENVSVERRKTPRFRVRLPIDYSETPGIIGAGLVADISQAGLCIHSVHQIQIGAKLEIRVYLLKEEFGFDNIEGTGKVIWKAPHAEAGWEGYKHGLYIMQMAPEDRERLERYLTMLQEEENSHDGETPFDDYQAYIFDLRNTRS
jgi:PilZ domain